MSLKVLMVLPAYLPESLGGAEKQAHIFSRGLRRRGVPVSILAPQERPVGKVEEIDESGVHVRRVNVTRYPWYGGRYMLSFLYWTVAVVVWMLRRRHDFNVVYIYHARLHAVGPVIAARLLGVPVVAKLGRGGEDFDLTPVRRKKLIGRVCYPIVRDGIDRFLANSTDMLADLEAHGISAQRTWRIPNGVEIPAEVSRSIARPDDEGLVEFVYTGRLALEKRLDVLLEAFARLGGGGWRLTLVGDGPLEQELRDQVAALEMSDCVIFTGRVENVPKYLVASHFFISASESEGMSNSLLEAISHGTVPVVSRVSGVDDIVTDGETGLVFRANDVDALAVALRRAVTMSAEARALLGERCREQARVRFSIEAVVRAVQTKLEGLVARTG
ncbi:MAG: glycosyltransferase family 4 protein [Gammaproteobacteria bacterium]